MRVALKFAYDGKSYHGYARQPNLKTIEGEIIDILKNSGYIDNPINSNIQSASRTDKGVSALGNVIAFNTEIQINNLFDEVNIKDDIIFYGYKKIDDEFYPRYAKQRIYRYFLKRDDFDIDALKSYFSHFIGTYNFTNFARIEPHKNPVRTIKHIEVAEIEDFFTIDFYAQTYLWHQIRRIISAILKLNKNKIVIEDVLQALNEPDRPFDFGVAPSEPLILIDVLYSFSFNIDKIKEKNKYLIEKKLINEIRRHYF